MISYEPLWKTMKHRRITTYTLIKDYGFSRGTLDSLRQGRNISTATLNQLCNILSCDVEEVIRHIPDETGTDDRQNLLNDVLSIKNC